MVVSILISSIATLIPPTQALPVKVFILAGQSNMEGHGIIKADPNRNGGLGSLEYVAKNPTSDQKLKALLNQNGTWKTRDDVWIQYFERKGKLTVGYGVREDCIGPELGFGAVVGDSFTDSILLIKLSWGGKSLAVDFRPPSSGGTVGPFYTNVVNGVRDAIANLNTNFPELKGRTPQIVGFGWHQGWNDRIDDGFVREYEQNMVNFIKDVRKDLRTPNLPFVIAETGMGGTEETNRRALELMDAQASVSRKPEFKSNVAFVGTRSFWRPPSESPSNQGYHWNSNGETYFLIGDAMGRAMTNLIKRDQK